MGLMTLREITEGVFIVAGCACLLTVMAKEIDKPAPVIKRVEVCSPMSVDAYSPVELRRIAGARERMGRVK